MAVSKLAILVVYYLKDDDDLPLMRIHLERIRRHTSVAYTIFGVANRATDAARELARAEPNLVLCEVAATESRASREHGYYLDALFEIALASDATHFCTLDVDSFPIDDSWIDVLVDAAPSESGLAGVLRRENGDTALPHPSCIFATRGFLERFRPSFSPAPRQTPALRKFLRATGQAPDTAVELGSILWNAELPWGQLLRTNVNNPHWLMAAIYGDIIFHLGGIARGKLFRRDLEGSLAHRLSRPLERIPTAPPALASLRRRTLTQIRSGPERRMAANNREAYFALRDWLVRDSDGLVAHLRGDL